MVKITFDDQEIDVPAGMTVLQAARLADVEIPVFCYHERLEIAGNCRMCLVEMQGAPKPIASCAMPVNDGMIIRTKTPMVDKARKGVLEFLLANHPLDCPICDQGGECDLQDITMGYGCGTSRFEEDKRAVPPKHLGPLVKTEMNRCIHCTRCVRFLEDVAGVPELGVAGRGENAEIQSYLDQALTSELSGNIVDLCPVGALTSRPYAFKGRPWELTKTESIDVMDALGSAIRVDCAYGAVQRILPRLNEDINEEWLSDKSRHACDGLKVQRLDTPYIRDAQGRLQPASWDDALELVASRLKTTPAKKIAALAGDLVEVDAQVALLDLMRGIGVAHTDCRQDGAALDPRYRAGYIFNSTLAGVDAATECLIIGANVREDAPLLAARLRKRYSTGELRVSYLGAPLPTHREFTFPVERLGDDPAFLDTLLGGKHPLFERLKKAERAMIIVGQDALIRRDGGAILGRARRLAELCDLVTEDWNGFNVLHKAAGRVGGLDVGFVPGKEGHTTKGILEAAARKELDVVYLLGADEIETSALQNTFVIYQGHHGDKSAHVADVILPGLAYTEKDAHFVNTEGRVQKTQLALKGPGEAREDWRIVADLAKRMDIPLGYENAKELHERLVRANPAFVKGHDLGPQPWGAFGDEQAPLDKDAFVCDETPLYLSNPVTRASETMAAVMAALKTPCTGKGGCAHG